MLVGLVVTSVGRMERWRGVDVSDGFQVDRIDGGRNTSRVSSRRQTGVDRAGVTQYSTGFVAG